MHRCHPISPSPKKRYMLGSYTAVLFDQIIPSGSIEYEFIIAVFKKKATTPFLFVTSERKNWDAVTQAALKLGVDPAQAGSQKTRAATFCVCSKHVGHQ